MKDVKNLCFCFKHGSVGGGAERTNEGSSKGGEVKREKERKKKVCYFRESNPSLHLGRVKSYRWTKVAAV